MEWKKLIDKALGVSFDAPQYDPQKGRDKLVRQIDLAAKQHNEGTTRAPNRAWRAGGNDAIRFAAKIDGKPVLLDGDEAVFVPASRFQDFLAQLKKFVLAGDLDKDIKAALDSEGPLAGNSSSASLKAGGGTRVSTPQGSLNIGVAGKRRGKNPMSFDDIRAFYLEEGKDAGMIDAAIAKRKDAEKA